MIVLTEKKLFITLIGVITFKNIIFDIAVDAYCRNN